MSKKYHELSDGDVERRSTNIDGKTIYFKEAVSKMIKQEFAALSEKDCDFIFECLILADTLLKTHMPGHSLKNYTAENLDFLIDLWNENSKNFICTENEFATSVGSAFGHYVNKTLGSTWTVITDAYGTDFSCQIDHIMLRGFPFSSVLKAVNQKRENSLEHIVLMLKRQKQILESEL
jgi:hypothetical protein